MAEDGQPGLEGNHRRAATESVLLPAAAIASLSDLTSSNSGETAPSTSDTKGGALREPEKKSVVSPLLLRPTLGAGRRVAAPQAAVGSSSAAAAVHHGRGRRRSRGGGSGSGSGSLAYLPSAGVIETGEVVGSASTTVQSLQAVELRQQELRRRSVLGQPVRAVTPPPPSSSQLHRARSAATPRGRQRSVSETGLELGAAGLGASLLGALNRMMVTDPQAEFGCHDASCAGEKDGQRLLRRVPSAASSSSGSSGGSGEGTSGAEANSGGSGSGRSLTTVSGDGARPSAAIPAPAAAIAASSSSADAVSCHTSPPPLPRRALMSHELPRLPLRHFGLASRLPHRLRRRRKSPTELEAPAEVAAVTAAVTAAVPPQPLVTAAPATVEGGTGAAAAAPNSANVSYIAPVVADGGHKLTRRGSSVGGASSSSRMRRLHSFVWGVNAEGQPVSTGSVAFPYNINLRDFLLFSFAPTLVYEPNFPRTTGIRPGYLLEKVSLAAGMVIVGSVVMTNHMLPVFAAFDPLGDACPSIAGGGSSAAAAAEAAGGGSSTTTVSKLASYVGRLLLSKTPLLASKEAAAVGTAVSSTFRPPLGVFDATTLLILPTLMMCLIIFFTTFEL